MSNLSQTIESPSKICATRSDDYSRPEPNGLDFIVPAPPFEVDAIMRKVPEGRLITLSEICQRLAKKHKAQYCCTLTTGIYITIAARVAEEDREKGITDITPYWRTLKMDGFLNDKYPGGALAKKKLLEKEGFTRRVM